MQLFFIIKNDKKYKHFFIKKNDKNYKNDKKDFTVR